MMEPDEKAPRNRPLFGMQVGLRQLLLATLCAGVWFAHWTNQDAIARLEPRLANLHSLSPELIVADPNKIAVVQLPSPWFGIPRWDVYVPTGGVRICASTEGIDHSGFPDNYASVLIPKGQYKIQLDEKKEAGVLRFLVTQNGQSCLNIDGWLNTGSGGRTTNSDVSNQTIQSDGNTPVVLMRQRYSAPGASCFLAEFGQ